MAVSDWLRPALFSSLLVAAGPMTQAFAQHVVTDEEAGKLTLEALTAAPVYHPAVHPLYRTYYRPAMATRTLHRRGEARVRTVAYRTRSHAAPRSRHHHR